MPNFWVKSLRSLCQNRKLTLVTTFDELRREALALSVEQRVLLAESLLGSLPPPGLPSEEAEELAEAERREQEIQSGRVQPISEVELLKRVQSKRTR